jgi:hypothetical protein
MKRGITFVLVAIGVVAAGWTLSALADDPPPPAKLYIYSGTIQSIDLQARTITVQASAADNQKFVVPTDAEILVRETNPRGELKDLMIGNRVEVKYTVDDGVSVAHRVAMLDLKTP